MNLLILRHADADTPASHDDDRALSEKGIAQSRRVGRFCRANAIVPEVILTSPLRRAHETAELFAAEASAPRLEDAPFLACGMRPEKALAELAAWENAASVMLVGHEPDLGVLIAHLLRIPAPGRIHVRKASLTMLALEKLTPAVARLEFSLPCRLMG
jgi:phosphohistidine phosphatase